MTALLQHLEFRNFGLFKLATPFICSKGRFVSKGCLHSSKDRERKLGGADG